MIQFFSAPAKINLTLRVGPRREDGFHPLVSWMVAVGLFDTIGLECAPPSAGGPAPVHLSTDCPDLPTDQRNLVVRAALAFADALPARPPDLRIELVKRIPIGAGLGGGSSDAACTLQALNRLWEAHWPTARLADFSASLGSDLPFFFHGPSSVCRGRGQIVRPVPAPRAAWAVLVLPPFALSTAEVYRRLDEMRAAGQVPPVEVPEVDAVGAGGGAFSEPPWEGWASLPAGDLLPLLHNDLEPPAFSLRPELDQLRRDLERRLGRAVRMSGSGSTVFTLYDDDGAAQSAARQVHSDLRLRTEAVHVGSTWQAEAATADLRPRV